MKFYKLKELADKLDRIYPIFADRVDDVLRKTAIQSQIRRWKPFYQMVERRLNEFSQYLDSITNMAQELQDDEDVQYLMGRGWESDISSLNAAFQRSSRDLVQALGWLKDLKDIRSLEILIRSFTEFQEGLEKLNQYAVSFKNDIGEDVADYQQHVTPGSYQLAHQLVNVLPQKINELEKVMIYLPSLIESEKRYTAPVRQPPEHEEVELMYHASINAKNIVGEGFSAEIPEQGGLGGAQSDATGKPSVSFTSDLYHAKEIMRALKEAVAVMNGEYKASTLLSHIKQDPSGEEILRHFKYQSGIDFPETPTQLFRLYKMYLQFADRYDPVFFGGENKFAKVFSDADPENIGIVKAKIDMTNSGIDYVPGQEEFRVPIPAIISIEGLIQ